MNKNIKHIFVDLDGTLIKTDLLFEAAIKFIKQNPFNLFQLFTWAILGKTILKQRLAQNIDIDVSSLPYQIPLLDYLSEKKQQGYRLILATASHERYAKDVAEHLQLFDDVIATDAENNMKGLRKLAEMKRFAKEDYFSYAGDSNADRPIWKEAASNIFVNAPSAAIKEAEAQGKADHIIKKRKFSSGRAFLKEMRPHQWAKNALIFVPLLTAHEYMNSEIILSACIAFICFSLCASGVYFLNDLLDLDADRHHKTKNTRPIASGDLSIPVAIMGGAALIITAFAIAWAFLTIEFFIVLSLYFLITNLYSFFLKHISTADVMTLAILYTSRVAASSAATGIALSSWLMAFMIFVFVSLAYLKRYIEVSALKEKNKKAEGRGYSAADNEAMFSLGIANITASVVVLAFYINSDEVVQLYKSPEILWGLCLLMLYWGNRIWVGAKRGKIDDDPVVFAIKDRVSRMVGMGFLLIILAARFIEI